LYLCGKLYFGTIIAQQFNSKPRFEGNCLDATGIKQKTTTSNLLKFRYLNEKLAKSNRPCAVRSYVPFRSL
jgi:hypothetical protein